MSVALLPEELDVLRLTAELWNAFMDLPKQHIDDLQETKLDIHRIQNRVMARATRRAYPEDFGSR